MATEPTTTERGQAYLHNVQLRFPTPSGRGRDTARPLAATKRWADERGDGTL